VKELSFTELEKYVKKKGWKLDDASRNVINSGKSVVLLDKLIQVVGRITKTVFMLEGKLAKKSEADDKINKQIASAIERISLRKDDRVKEWEFTIERDRNGFIKKVKARSVK